MTARGALVALGLLAAIVAARCAGRGICRWLDEIDELCGYDDPAEEWSL